MQRDSQLVSMRRLSPKQYLCHLLQKGSGNSTQEGKERLRTEDGGSSVECLLVMIRRLHLELKAAVATST